MTTIGVAMVMYWEMQSFPEQVGEGLLGDVIVNNGFVGVVVAIHWFRTGAGLHDVTLEELGSVTSGRKNIHKWRVKILRQ